MRPKKNRFIIGFLSLTILGALMSCAANKAPLQIENSLSPDELAFYSNDFDQMREDQWDRAGYLYRKEQVQNFKQAAMHFDSGKLIIQTKTGSFSKGGFSSRYALRGDFDIQLDFQMAFMKGIYGMDQLFSLAVFDKSLKKGKINNVSINLSMSEGWNPGYLYSNCHINGQRREGNYQRIESFIGTFRILRKGKNISTLYKIKGTSEWKRLNTFRVTDADMIIGFQVRNFFSDRTTIRAEHEISAEFDSLKINAAQQIIEDDI
ncbi:MAG: hypothetical protein R3274_04475 [Desulfobacterales bacterium]|nr:hypothetical protein [Desulfobacterales bacterium]